MALQFVTGNKNKLAEAQRVIPHLVQLEMNLPEIQDIDAHTIIAEKLAEARKSHVGELVVEDTSLYLDCLNGLPGPLIKWFEKAIGNEGIYKIAKAFGNDRAEARVTLGYVDGTGSVHFFEGSIRGQIVAPRGDSKFGWDPIFLPGGEKKTFAEMDPIEKQVSSMRRIAFEKLKTFLESR